MVDVVCILQLGKDLTVEIHTADLNLDPKTEANLRQLMRNKVAEELAKPNP